MKIVAACAWGIFVMGSIISVMAYADYGAETHVHWASLLVPLLICCMWLFGWWQNPTSRRNIYVPLLGILLVISCRLWTTFTHHWSTPNFLMRTAGVMVVILAVILDLRNRLKTAA